MVFKIQKFNIRENFALICSKESNILGVSAPRKNPQTINALIYLKFQAAQFLNPRNQPLKPAGSGFTRFSTIFLLVF